MATDLHEVYGRVASMTMLKETTANTAVIPTAGVLFNEETLQALYEIEPTMQVAADRSKMIRYVQKNIPAISGDLKISIEPKQFGSFLQGVFGTVSSGVYMNYGRRLMAGTTTGTPQVGATLLQATSLATGTVASLVNGNAYYDLVPGTLTGAFTSSNVVTGTNPDATTFSFTPSAVINSTAFSIGDTVTGSTSSKSATVSFVNENEGYMLVTAPSGNFTANEKITGTAGGIATMINMDTTVYAHVGTLPSNSMVSYSLQVNYYNSAIRYMGVRFTSLDPINQANNVLGATIKIIGQSAFRHAVVGAITANTGGTAVITVDQTQGLVVGDSIKIYRPSTQSFIALNGASVYTNTITSINPGVSVSIAVLTTSTAVGDLLMLAPQTTPTYTTANEMAWIGGAKGEIGATIQTVSTSVLEDFTISVVNDWEARWQAAGTNISNRFPAILLQKGLSAKGSFKAYYADESFVAKMRANTAQALRIRAIGPNIVNTTIPYELRFSFANVQFLPFQTPVNNDKIVEQAVTFDVYKDSTTSTYARALLITNVTSF